MVDHTMRPNKNRPTVVGFSKDAPKPLVYEALADLNRHFEQVLADLERLRALGLFPHRFGRQFLKACQATLAETRAWANFEVVETLHQREERDWARFGRLRQKEEKALRGSNVLLPTETRIPRSQKGRPK